MKIEDARVLITGGSRGIGLATAKRLAERGAQVAISGRDADALAAAKAAFGCTTIQGDVSRETEAQLMVDEAISELGGLDAVVNNAAIGRFSLLVDTEPEDVRAVLDVNVLGALLVARSAAKHFIGQGQGTILNVGSTAARKGFARGSAYAASKFALTALTECWRDELRQHGVRVMQINPERGPDRLQPRDGPGVQPDEAPGRRHRPGDRRDARDAGPRLHHRADGLGNEPEVTDRRGAA